MKAFLELYPKQSVIDSQPVEQTNKEFIFVMAIFCYALLGMLFAFAYHHGYGKTSSILIDIKDFIKTLFLTRLKNS